MAHPIIAAVRPLPFKESVTHTLIELAHRASIYGVVNDSITFMAEKCHCSKRTFQRHVLLLIKAKILRKTVTKKIVKVKIGEQMEPRIRNEVNIYTFVNLSWKKPASSPLPIAKMAANLPYLQDRQKSQGLTEEIQTLEKGLRFCTPGSDAYVTTEEKLTRLRALKRGGSLPMAVTS